MGLFQFTIKNPVRVGGYLLEPGMSVEVISKPSVPDPLNHNSGQLVKEAFLRKYGIEINQGMWSAIRGALKVEKR